MTKKLDVIKFLALLFLCPLAIENVKAMPIENDYFKVDVPLSFSYYNESLGSFLDYMFESSSATIDVKLDTFGGSPKVQITATIEPSFEGTIDSDVIRLLESLQVKRGK
jgi:hypothetical protein